jgi:hypothetical protein
VLDGVEIKSILLVYEIVLFCLDEASVITKNNASKFQEPEAIMLGGTAPTSSSAALLTALECDWDEYDVDDESDAVPSSSDREHRLDRPSVHHHRRRTRKQSVQDCLRSKTIPCLVVQELLQEAFQPTKCSESMGSSTMLELPELKLTYSMILGRYLGRLKVTAGSATTIATKDEKISIPETTGDIENDQ